MGNAPVNNKTINIQVGNGNGLENKAKMESTNTMSPNLNTSVNKCIDNGINGNILEEWMDYRIKFDSQITLSEYCVQYNIDDEPINDIITENRAGLGIIPMRDNKTLMGAVNPGSNMRENMTKAIGTIIQVANSSVDGESSNEIDAAIQLATPCLEHYNNALWSQGSDGNVKENDINNPSMNSVELPSSILNDTISDLSMRERSIKVENRMMKAMAASGLIKTGSDLVMSLFGKASRPKMATIPALGNNTNVRVPVSNSDALNSGVKVLPVNTVIDALTTVFRASGLAEKHFSTCKGALLAATSSSPSVKVTPGSANSKMVWDNLTGDEKKINCEVCSIAGGTFGLQVGIGNGPMTMNSDLNVIQKVADSVTIGNGITLTDVNKNKELFKRLERISTEVLVAKPSMIQSYEVPQSIWITDINFFESFSGSRMIDLKYDNSVFVNPAAASGRLSEIKRIEESTSEAEKVEVDVIFMLPDIYTLDSVYENYEATCVFVLSCYSNEPSARPGLLLNVSGVNKAVFVSAVRQPDSSGLWRASISTSLLHSLDTYGGKGSIGFCVVGKTSANCSLSVLSASTNLIRRAVSSRVQSWVYDRKKAENNILSYMFTVNPLIQISSSPLDVVNLWMEFISAYTPFVSGILFKIRDPKFSLAIKAIQLYLINGAALEKSRFAAIENVRTWIESALLDMPNWMIFRGNAPFYAITHECIPQMAWKLLAFSYGAAMANVYEMGGNSSAMSALPVISELSQLVPKIPVAPSSIKITQLNFLPRTINNRRVRDAELVRSEDPVVAFGESHLHDVLIMAGQAY